MDPLSAVVAVIGVLLAGGVGALLTARSSAVKLRAEAAKIEAEAEAVVLGAQGPAWEPYVDRIERALAKCEIHAADLESALQRALNGIQELKEATLAAREQALILKERVDTIERDQPAQQQQAVKQAVDGVVRGLGALDPNQHEEGK